MNNRDNTLTWNQVRTLSASGKLAAVNISATASSLSSYVYARPDKARRTGLIQGGGRA